MSPRLSIATRYLLRRSAESIGLCLASLIALASLVEAIEIFRRVDGRNFGTALAALAAGIPASTTKVLPFAVLLGLTGAFANLARNNELVALRIAGRPIARMVLPAALLSLAIGLLDLLLLDPLAAAMQDRRETLYRQATAAPLPAEQVWLTAPDRDGATWFVKLSGGLKEPGVWSHGMALAADASGRILQRLDGTSIRLDGGRPVFATTTRAADGQAGPGPVAGPALGLQDADADLLRRPAEAVAWTGLPAAIARLQRLGLDSTGYRLAWHRRSADILLLLAFAPIAAAVALGGGAGRPAALSFGFGISLGFLLFFAAELIGAFGAAGRLPVPLAAWAPAFLAAVLAAISHLTVEDG